MVRHGDHGCHYHAHNHHDVHHGSDQGSPRYYPTHDPDGYPLPDGQCDWPYALLVLPVGVMFIAACSVMFIGMLVVGAVLTAFGCICAVGCHCRNVRKYDEWALAHPEAARAFEARGGYETVPHIFLPTAQEQATPVQVVAAQSQGPAVATGVPSGYVDTGIPSGYVATGIPDGYGQPAGAAPIVQNGTLVQKFPLHPPRKRKKKYTRQKMVRPGASLS
jgi:hypothetical protein